MGGGREESEKKNYYSQFSTSRCFRARTSEIGGRQLKKIVILLHDMPFLRKIYDPLFSVLQCPSFFPLCCLNADKVIFLTSIKLFFPFLFFFVFLQKMICMKNEWKREIKRKKKKNLLHLGKIYNKIYKKLESLFFFLFFAI